MLELSVYADIPHLLVPVVTDPKKATQALRWAVREMDRRYHLMADAGIRNIASYNKLADEGKLNSEKAVKAGREDIYHEGHMPIIVIIIDELADLMMISPKELEESIMRLAQKARASGIHLVLATQRPSVDVITGVIKANFPTRISFKVSSRHDSRTILDCIGAERLLGAGDMLFQPPTSSDMLRVHGAFITDQEIQRVADHVRQQGQPVYREEILQAPPEESNGGGGGGDTEDDEMYDRAVSLVSQSGQASISMVQRHLRIGYNRAARLIERMENQGVVGPADGSKPREVLVSNLAEGS
jgi:S-DNA-T family DNA segregation ATPase FtsK/SpoIIIE